MTASIKEALRLERLTQELIDQGKIIEAGWIGLRLAAIPLNAPADQIEEMRNAFFAGAQHLFKSIMAGLDGGTEPTDNDMRRMDLIEQELNNFIEGYVLRNFPTGGTA